ncbi:MAG TPA: glutathione S-transferase family protein [Polyangiaceae bacterium]|nr:glutathione S-transferase family protein [Polyangiaceae bacterium]
MILIGQYDSPFVRRVAIALHHYALPFEHRPWSVWANAVQIAQYNPLRRVPTLLLDDGSALVDTFAILDSVDELVPPEHALVPRSGVSRRDILRVAALASGIADKAVTLLYSALDLMQPSPAWSERCRTQIVETFTLLEAERAQRKSSYWFGALLSHADIAVACGYRFTCEAHPGLIERERFPKLSALADRCEALPEFKAVYLPITNNLTKS